MDESVIQRSKPRDWPEVRGHSASETALVNSTKAPRNVVLVDVNLLQ